MDELIQSASVPGTYSWDTMSDGPPRLESPHLGPADDGPSLRQGPIHFSRSPCSHCCIIQHCLFVLGNRASCSGMFPYRFLVTPPKQNVYFCAIINRLRQPSLSHTEASKLSAKNKGLGFCEIRQSRPSDSKTFVLFRRGFQWEENN